MTPEQKFKLEKVIELVSSTLEQPGKDPKILTTWLRVSGDYCYEVADAIRPDTGRE